VTSDIRRPLEEINFDAMTLYLIGGGDIKAGKLETIDRQALSESPNQNVFVLDLTTNDEDKLEKYRFFLKAYFENLGAKKINFFSTTVPPVADNIIAQSGLVYIPGGNTEILMENIKKHNLSSTLKSAAGTIVGNSAGALVLCDNVVLTKDEDVLETKVIKGVGLVDFSIDVHYDPSHDLELSDLSKDGLIYAVPEESVIIIRKHINFLGPIWRFSKGKKEVVK